MHAAVLIPVLVVAVGFIASCLTVLVRGAQPRYLPKWAWALIICVTIPWGGIAYLAFGKDRTQPAIPEPAPRRISQRAARVPRARRLLRAGSRPARC